MKNKVLYLLLCMFFLISSLPIQKTQACVKDTDAESKIMIEGTWGINTRSLSHIPFTAKISYANLSVECTSPNYDISITLTDSNGEAVWQRDITASETSFVFIPLDGLPRGSYTLRISNDYGGYLWGTFQL